MATMQKPISGSWYVNRTGKLVKVSLLLYAGEVLSRVMLEYLDGMKVVITKDAWSRLDLRIYSLRTETKTEELWNV